MSSPARVLIQSIRQKIRGAELTAADELQFIARLLVWTKLNQPASNQRGTASDDPGFDSATLGQHWGAFADTGTSDAVRCAFIGADRFPYTRLSPDMLSNAIESSLSVLLLTDSARLELSQWLQERALQLNNYGKCDLSPQIASFIVSLLHAPSGSHVLIPGNYGDFAAIAARRSNLTPEVVSIEPPFLASVDTVLTGGDLRYQNQDLFSGEFETSSPGVHWDSAIILPPLGLRQKTSPAIDLGLMTGEARATDLALEKVRGTAVILVAMSFLFARGHAERTYRKRLVSSGRLQAIIIFPAGLLQGTAIAFALLVLGPGTERRSITVCRVEDQDIQSPQGKLRASKREFTGAERVSRLLAEPDGVSCINVPTEEIEANDFDLSPGRYLFQKISFFTEHAGELRPLGELFKIIKPQHLPDAKSEETFTVSEVSLGEVPEFGCVQNAMRSREVDAFAWKSHKAQGLALGDVLLSVKGTIGRATVVGDLHGSRYPMVPSSSLVVLRAQREAKPIDPRFVVLYLRSPVVQSQLQNLSFGTIPNIPLQTLRELPIWVPSVETQRKWAEGFECQVELQHQVEDIQRRQAEVTLDLWRMNGLEE
jgi:hypothetical protein